MADGAILTVREEALWDDLLPLLRGNVFHVTSRERWSRIRSEGSVSPNIDGAHGNTFPQSGNSIGRLNGFVCLFDLRTASEDEIDNGRHCFNFLAPNPHTPELSFLLLSHARYGEILSMDSLEAGIDRTLVHIPCVEVWWRGPLPVEAIDRVLNVNVVLRVLSAEQQAHLDALIAASGER